jgi:DNA mismatch endonuclease, patch repair protein
MDIVNKATRSKMMSGVRSKNSKAELEIRRRLFRLGFRYRLHLPSLPGKPDMVFRKYRAVIFVNGCFWHNHDCSRGNLPETRRGWWKQKLNENRKRDVRVLQKLHSIGWRTLVIWECSFRFFSKELRNKSFNKIIARAVRFLNSTEAQVVISGKN